MTTNLVVADESRTEKTICLAVSPSLKACGISGRARLFEVVQRVRGINAARLSRAPGRRFTGSSCSETELRENPSLELDYIVARPQMAHYIEKSAAVFDIYQKFVSPDDIHVYSIDEVFIDAAPYLKTRGITAREFAGQIIREVLRETGITAAAGIGTNLYLCKVAMDIEAKRSPADRDGVRIAQLDEMSYRHRLWSHRPLTDFWRVGRGYADRLEANGLYTMGDIARQSVRDEDRLYRLFGVNAELLIDHAWGWEPCTIAEIKAYRPESSSISSGQVLHTPYDYEKGKLIVREMAEMTAYSLFEKGLVADQVTLAVGYDRENLTDPERRKRYTGPVKTDRYGREVPKSAHGSANLGAGTSSESRITAAFMELYGRIVDPALLIRRVYLTANHVVLESEAAEPFEQLDLFADVGAERERREAEQAALDREKRRQEAGASIRRKYGKNAVLKAMDLQEGATAAERNRQIGGHRA